MNDRERFLACMQFRAVDRMPRWEWAFRRDTTERWHREGLPVAVPEAVGWVEHFGLDRGCGYANGSMAEKLEVSVELLPDFGGTALEEDERTVLFRNRWGALVKASKTQQGIPQYLSFGVRNRDDFARFKSSWNPLAPGRYPDDWEERRRRWETRTYPVCAWTYGWYGLLRELMGVEELSVAFHEDAALIDEISEFWGDFLIRAFDRAFREVDVDYILFWEDLAFKTAPLLSPSHFRRYFLPHYRRVIDHFRTLGVRLFMVDSDGDINRILPLWVEAGINMMGPFEVDAGMAVGKVRQTYGKSLAVIGGIDKRQVVRGTDAIEAEVGKRLSGMGETGYIATLDHAPIPEISYGQYRDYRRILQRLCDGG